MDAARVSTLYWQSLGYMTAATATSFATRQDLARFAACITEGGSVNHCLGVGDNGVGAFGDPTWDPNGDPIVALPAPVAVRNKQVKVTLSIGHKQPFICLCRDESPPGIIDLNPAALIAAGLEPDADIEDKQATWAWA